MIRVRANRRHHSCYFSSLKGMNASVRALQTPYSRCERAHLEIPLKESSTMWHAPQKVVQVL